jgi:hypothetical protein
MRTKFVRPAVVAAVALAAVGLSTAPANAATTITFRMACSSGYLQIACQVSPISGGTAPYTDAWTSDPYTYVNNNGSGTCSQGHSFSVTLTVTDAKHATSSRTSTGQCNAGPWT